MSRRSSATSLTTSASASTTDDPLMRDCYDLRRRLMQTEQSIKNLNPPSKLNRLDEFFAFLQLFLNNIIPGTSLC